MTTKSSPLVYLNRRQPAIGTNHQTGRQFRAIVVAVLAIVAVSLPREIVAQEALARNDRLWIMWEHVADAPKCDNRDECQPTRFYTTRLLGQPNAERLQRTFGMLDRLALIRGLPPEHPESPRICQHLDPEVLAGFQPEKMAMSQKIEALHGLEGVAIDLRSLQAPVGYNGDFGGYLQAEVDRRFRQAGIKILSEDERMLTPGRPKLNVYFSNTDPVSGCHYSVFASLSQTVLLTRNLQTKLEAGTWASSDGPSDDFPNGTESDAILRVLGRFIDDFHKANPAVASAGD